MTEATVSRPSASIGDRTNRDAWVIVRCFNEAPVVAGVIASLATHFPNIIGVDDGSTDGSADAMRSAGAHVVRHAVNLGAGAALQTGINFALKDVGAQFFICFDADGQHRMSDALAMLERLRNEPVDVIIGSRFLGTAVKIPNTRRLLLKGARTFERISSGAALTDAHNGLRVFNREMASRIQLTMPDMAYASELIRTIVDSKVRYAEHPVTIDYTPYSLAKGQKSVNAINIAVDVWLHRLLRGRR